MKREGTEPRSKSLLKAPQVIQIQSEDLDNITELLEQIVQLLHGIDGKLVDLSATLEKDETDPSEAGVQNHHLRPIKACRRDRYPR